MNLHDIVAGAIGAVNAHEQIALYRCTGVSNVKGIVTPTYAKKTLRAQIQRPSYTDIQLSERVARAKHAIKAWIDAPADTINRVDQKASDFIERADGTYWIIDSVRESYAPEGWLSVVAVQQLEKPKGVYVDADKPDDVS